MKRSSTNTPSSSKTTKTSCQDFLLDADAVCSIIRECKLAEVSELSFGGLHLAFSGAKAKAPEPLTPAKPSQSEEIIPTEKELRAIEEDGRRLADDRDTDELILTNPLEYERRLSEGALEDVES